MAYKNLKSLYVQISWNSEKWNDPNTLMNAHLRYKADWIAWFLHLVVGLFLGLILGVTLLSKGYFKVSWLKQGEIMPFLFGFGLIVGALASHYGDQIWLTSRNQVFPPESPKQNNISLILSLLIGLTGVVLVTYILLKHFETI